MPHRGAEHIFTRIYLNNEWGDNESRSGPGSTVLRTELLRRHLAALLRRFGIQSLLDLGCGDFNWMRLVDLTSVEYIGGDVVPALIQHNVRRYTAAGRRFVVMDMLRDPLPMVDLILCRESLVHFSFSDIAKSIWSMKQSGSTYLLATTFTAHARNDDIPTGGWRPINLNLPPFNFPEPLEVIGDVRLDGTYPDKALCLYRLDTVTKPACDGPSHPSSPPAA